MQNALSPPAPVGIAIAECIVAANRKTSSHTCGTQGLLNILPEATKARDLIGDVEADIK
jgi:hypothetical protein